MILGVSSELHDCEVSVEITETLVLLSMILTR